MTDNLLMATILLTVEQDALLSSAWIDLP